MSTKEVRLQSGIVLDCHLQNYGQEILKVVKNIYGHWPHDKSANCSKIILFLNVKKGF